MYSPKLRLIYEHTQHNTSQIAFAEPLLRRKLSPFHILRVCAQQLLVRHVRVRRGRATCVPLPPRGGPAVPGAADIRPHQGQADEPAADAERGAAAAARQERVQGDAAHRRLRSGRVPAGTAEVHLRQRDPGTARHVSQSGSCLCKLIFSFFFFCVVYLNVPNINYYYYHIFISSMLHNNNDKHL